MKKLESLARNVFNKMELAKQKDASLEPIFAPFYKRGDIDLSTVLINILKEVEDNDNTYEVEIAIFHFMDEAGISRGPLLDALLK